MRYHYAVLALSLGGCALTPAPAEEPPSSAPAAADAVATHAPERRYTVAWIDPDLGGAAR
jgi:hypothetical protein